MDILRKSNASAAGRLKKKSKELSMAAKVSMKFWEVMSLYDPSWATRIGVHFGLFQNAIEGSGTEEQIEYWIPKCQKMEIFGCFGMTELGHGSFVRGLETLAHYDKKTQEFVIHSPTQTSTKWWIGGAGQTATHCIVFAQLYIDGYHIALIVFTLDSIMVYNLLLFLSVQLKVYL